MIPRPVRFDALLYVCNLVVAQLPSASLRMLFYRRAMKLDLGPGAHILSGLWLDARGCCRIGENSVINQRCRLDNRGEIWIGANVSISPEVHILTADHDARATDFAGRLRGVRIEDFVFVGSRAMILPGVTLGRGCVVGAGSVVTRDVEPYAIVAGVPCRTIGRRPENLDYRCDGKRRFI
jgi:maltose O-acetyltransferase